MKILLVNYEYKGQGGGAGQQLYYLGQALRDFGHDVSMLIGWDYNYGEPELLSGVSTYIVKHKRKNIQLSTPLGMLFFVLRGLFRINQITRKSRYDIIQFYFSVPTGILKYGIVGKIPYVVSLRGMDIPGLQKDKNKVLSILTAVLNKHIVQNAALVLSNSKESANLYNIFAPEINIASIPNAIETNVGNKDSYSDKITKLVTVGRLVPWKRMDLLIDSIVKLKEKYPEIILDIFGQGYQYEILQQHIKDNQAEDFVTLKGFCEKGKLMEELSEYDLFAFMSTGDSCPNVLLEAMAVGLPVVAAESGGSKDIIEDGVTGVFVKPDGIEDAIKKLEYCINNPVKMKVLAINGRKRVEEHYSIKSTVQRHINMFTGVVHH